MWSGENRTDNKKIIAIAEAGYTEISRREEKGRKLSSFMAMVLGAAVTLEIIIAGAMMLNIDLHGVDGIALGFVFMVLYFGVVAVLTDK